MVETAQASQTPQTFDLVRGPKVLLMGDSGTGKTESLISLPDSGIMPFVIGTEPNCYQILKKMPKEKFHFKYISPAPEGTANWSHIHDMMSKINSLSYENLTKVSDPFKQANNRILDMVAQMNNFKCDCCKKEHGSVSNWNTDRAMVVDSLSGLSDMAMALVVGNKPVRSQPDWGVAQNAIRMLLGPLTTTIKCTVIVVAHMDREKDEITGGTTITVKTLGQKLGPDLPRMFSDVIRARRDADKFTWDTADSQATVVARHLPIKSGLEPKFKSMFDNWTRSGGKIEATS